jgi:hypothetical protein
VVPRDRYQEANTIVSQAQATSEQRGAQVLGQLLGQIWGPWGYWFMIAAVGIAFFSTTLSNQDGWARLLSQGSRILLRGAGVTGGWTSEETLRAIFIVGLAIMPVAVFLLFGNPVVLLQLVGAIEAAHLPVLAGLTLYVNRRTLPADLRPSPFVFGATIGSGLFFAGFALAYLWRIVAG